MLAVVPWPCKSCVLPRSRSRFSPVRAYLQRCEASQQLRREMWPRLWIFEEPSREKAVEPMVGDLVGWWAVVGELLNHKLVETGQVQTRSEKKLTFSPCTPS